MVTTDAVEPKKKHSQEEWNFSQALSHYAQNNRVALRNLESNTGLSMTFAKYTKDQIVEYLKAPDRNEKQLRDMSTYLYNISNYYRRLILYFARMPTFAYTVVPYNLDLSKKVNERTFRSSYQKVLNDLDKMNMRHEFQKILTTAFKQDVFYGYIYETNDSFIIQELDPDYCEISSIEDGCYNISWDSSYFDSRKEKLENMDPEFTTLYNTYKSKGQKFKKQELDSTKTICIKINEEFLYPVPPFVSLFSALADIEDYRSLSKASTEINNYKALSLQIPLDKDGSPLIDWEKSLEYYRQLVNVLPDNIGAILTPMKIDSWDFQKSGQIGDVNLVSKAESTFFAESGVNSQLLGGGDKSSSSAMEMSREVDISLVTGVLRQFERFVNRRLKRISGTHKFKINFLDVTVYNEQKRHQDYVKACTFGLPFRMEAAATAGKSPSALQNSAYLENIVLDLASSEVPLKSSHTSTGDDEAGRPKDDVVGDAGEITREQN